VMVLRVCMVFLLGARSLGTHCPEGREGELLPSGGKAALPSEEVFGVGTQRASWPGEGSKTRRAPQASSSRRAAGRSYQHRSGDRCELAAKENVAAFQASTVNA
jgi:hypothetical protein